MSDIALDMNPASPSFSDLVLVNGDLQLVQSDAAIRQNLFQRLRLFLGEWFLDTTQGVPYYQVILLKNPNLDVVQATLLSVITKTEGIVELLDFAFDYDNAQRSLSVTFSARSTNGTVISVNQFRVGV